MKTFKSHLQEAVYKEKVRNYVFKKMSYVPLSLNMIERIFGSSKITTYHVLGIDNLKNLEKLQNSRKSVSSFTTADERDISEGVIAGRGLVAKIKGNLLLKANTDIYSEVDEQGRRWVPGEKLPLLFNDLYRFKGALFIQLFGKRYDEASILNMIRDKQIDGKLIDKYIRGYFKGIESLLKKYYGKKELLDIYVDNNRFSYNEIILNKIKILKVYIIESIITTIYEDDLPRIPPSKSDLIQFIRDKTGTRLPLEVVENPSTMSEMINNENL